MNHQTRVYDSVLELLSNVDNPTPLVRLRRVVSFRHATIYAKLEWYNPFGAVKDRVAANLVRDAEERGRIARGTHLVEPTSGNTGMALAMIANAKGYTLTATLSAKIPAEKRSTLRLFGAELVELDDDLCPAPGAPEGAIALAAQLGAKPGHHQLDQYSNPANPDAHYRTTGPEIWRQTDGRVTHFVAGLGTCGTITGTGRFLKEKRPAVRVLGVHPSEGHDIPGVRSLRQLRQTALFFPNEYDGLVQVRDEDAFEMSRRLCQEESLIAGPSSGMALVGALRSIPDEPDVVGVVVFPDNVFKYPASMRKHLPELFSKTKPTGTGLSSNLENIVEFARGSDDVISPHEAHAFLDRTGGSLVDVRSREEFAALRVPAANNVPLADLAGGYPVGLPADKSSGVVTICKVGERSLYGMLLLKSLGYQQVKNVRGGLDAWISSRLPTDPPASPSSRAAD